MAGLRFYLLLASIAVGSTSFAEPVRVVRGEGEARPRQPQVSIDDGGRIFIAFGRGSEIFVSRSNDRGKSFSPPAKVARLPQLALGMRRGPRMTTSGQSVVVAAISHETGNLTAWRSVDHGESWTEGVVVNDVGRSAREGLHGIANGPDGAVYLVWLDLRSGRTEIYLSKSADGGATWSENSRVYQSPSGTVCECCHPSVAVGADGQVVVMWRNLVDGDRDMYLATSDDGTSFGPAKKLGTGSWPLNACPMDGGDLAIDDEGEITTVWRRKNTVYTSSLGDASEIPIGEGVQPWITDSNQGCWIVWLSRRNGELHCLGPDTNRVQQLAERASDPVIESGEDNGIIVVAWEEQIEDDSRILAEVVSK